MRKLFNSKNWDEYRIPIIIAFISLVIGVVVLVIFIVMVLINNKPSANFDNELTQTVGVFIGGVVPIFISIATVLLIYITFESNRKEFIKISEANEKIIESNNFQQFNTTFDSMCDTLEKMINDFKSKKVFTDYLSEVEGYINSELKEGTYNNLKCDTDFNGIQIKDVFKEEIKDGFLDTALINRLKKMNYFRFHSEMESLNSGIEIIFEYLDNMFSNEKKMKRNESFYIFKLRNLFIDSSVKKTFMFNGILNIITYRYCIKYNLLNGIDNEIKIPYSVRSSSDMPQVKRPALVKGNFPSVINIGQRVYNFRLLKYLKENAFHK